MTEQLYRWFWKTKLPHRRGEVFRVICRGALNSCLIEFMDGRRYVTSRNALRKIKCASLPAPLSQLGRKIMPNNEYPDEIVEAVARAICVVTGRDQDVMTYHTIEPGVQEPYGEAWCHFINEARAALSAIAPYIAQREAEALERAAVVCDQEKENWKQADCPQAAYGSKCCAAAIRALKQKSPDDAGREG